MKVSFKPQVLVGCQQFAPSEGLLRHVTSGLFVLAFCFLFHASTIISDAMQAPSIDLVDTEYSACSIATCPNDRSIVACGLYQVVKDEQAEQIDESSPVTKRLGRCLLMRMSDDGKL